MKGSEPGRLTTFQTKTEKMVLKIKNNFKLRKDLNMWIRLGVDIPLTEEEEKELACSNDSESIIVKAMKERGFTINGDSYVPASCSPYLYDEATNQYKYIGYNEDSGEEMDFDFSPMDCTIATIEKTKF